ncbi:MAG: hypothetical protein HRF49_01350 [bacterium]
MRNDATKHLLAARHEQAPFFGLEMTLADRRLARRGRGFLKWLGTFKGVVYSVLFVSAAAYAYLMATAFPGGGEDFRELFFGIVCFWVTPIYACFNALAAGASTLSQTLEYNQPSEFALSGHAPERVGAEIYACRAYRHFPAAILYAGLVAGAIAYLEFRGEGVFNDFNPAFYPLFMLAALVMQYGLFAAAAFIGVLISNHAWRFIAVFGYFIVQMALPVFTAVLLSVSFQSSVNEEAAELAAMCAAPYGPVYYSINLAEASGGFSAYDAATGYALSMGAQIAIAIAWYLGTIALFRRRVLS